MRNIIIGTAGHIDHGKTTLIKALTGRSTDKLAEEIKRGISINLGFTYFDLPSGNRAGIVDVPGHERFIKNMLAGAAGIDVVLLTVAANEGVKPQTVEHVDILSYLDIKEGLIVLTKRDLADDEMSELVIDDIREQLDGTLFESSEIIEVDSLSGRGMDALVKKIDEISRRVNTKNERAAARLNIDRVFSMKGFGTIVTGTLSEGVIYQGDELILYPKEYKAKIRGVQVHDQTVEAARAGQRTALNISNLKRDEIERGDVLAKAETIIPTDILDVKLSLVRHTNVTLKLWDRVRVYLGAAEVLARVVPLDCAQIEKGEEGYCQLRLEKTAAVKKNDKFVIRLFSPLETIGGGIVLDPSPKKHGKADKSALEALKRAEAGGESALIEEYVKKQGGSASLKEISSYLSTDEPATEKSLGELTEQGSLVRINRLYFHANAVEAFNEACLEQLSSYHQKYPLRRGIAKEELKTRIGKLGVVEFDALLKILETENEIIIADNSIVSLCGFSVVYTPAQEKIRADIMKTLDDAGFSPPPLDVVLNSAPKEGAKVLESLIGDCVVMLDKQTAIHIKYYEKAKEALFGYMAAHKQITLAEFRDLTGSSRKYAMLLLDSFDRSGITVRMGDARVLRKR